MTARTELFAGGTLTDHSGTGVWAAFARSTAGLQEPISPDEMELRALVEVVRMADATCTIVSDHEGMVGIAQRGKGLQVCKPLREELDAAAASKGVPFGLRRRDQSLASRLAHQGAVGAAVEVTDARIPNLWLGDTRGRRPSPRAQLIRTSVYFVFWTVSFRL